MIQAFAEGKLAFLKSWLGITEAQSGPWNAFADVVRAPAKSTAESHQKRIPTPGQPEVTLPQWVDLHLQTMEEHLAVLKKIKPAWDALYPALTPEQRQKADQLIRRASEPSRGAREIGSVYGVILGNGSATEEEARQGVVGKPGGNVPRDHLSPGPLDRSSVSPGTLCPKTGL